MDTHFCIMELSKECRCVYVLLQCRFKRQSCTLCSMSSSENIKNKNLKSFDDVKDVRKCGYRICSCCSPITDHLKKERAEFEKFCQENGQAYFVNNGKHDGITLKDIQVWLGHSDFSTTANTYSHLDATSKVSSLSALSGAVSLAGCP